MKIIKKFYKSILLFMEALLYIGCYLIFFGLLGLKNKQLLVLSRTSVVITFTWLILAVLLTIIYGSFDIGSRKKKPIVTSMALIHGMTDCVSYLLLNIMNRNDDNNKTFKIQFIGLFILILILQFIWIELWVRVGDAFFFSIREPMDTLLVLSDMADEKRLCRIIGRFGKKYRIVKTLTYEDGDIKQEIERVSSVFLYNVPVNERTELANICYRKRKDIHFNPEVSDIIIHTARQAMFEDMTFFASEERGMTFEQRLAKRLCDIIISLVALIISSPIFLISAILIKACDGGPVFFKQKRATLNGRTFSIYKFRTMREDSGNRSVTADDDRITPIGRVLRKYRLDELPQFINILKGEMSVVGPRPEMLENVEKYTASMPEFKYRLRMKAGLTGYAQIVGKYNTSSKDKLVLDLLYIENYSFLKDIQLIFQTVLVLLKAEDSTEGFEDESDIR